DAKTGGNCSIPRRDEGTNERVNLLSLLRRRGLARADGPDRLVRYDRVRERGYADGVEHGRQLPAHDILGLPRFALGQRFTAAEDRRESRLLRRRELGRDNRIRIAVQRTALRVPDDDISATDVAQHVAGNFARVGAGTDAIRDVLGAELDRAAFEPVADDRQIDVRGTEQHFGLTVAADARAQCRNETLALRERTIHLPVAGNQQLASHSNLDATMGPVSGPRA